MILCKPYLCCLGLEESVDTHIVGVCVRNEKGTSAHPGCPQCPLGPGQLKMANPDCLGQWESTDSHIVGLCGKMTKGPLHSLSVLGFPGQLKILNS